jgi:hypothetical protein
VILAIRDRVFNVKMLPTLMAKAPILYQEISAGVNTNLNLDQTIQLAWLAQQIPEENIHRGVISPPEQVLLAKSPAGDEVLKPIADKIRALRDEVFFGSQATLTAASMMQPAELLQAEAARLSVLNGTATAGLAALSSDFLKSQGYQIAETGNADQLYTSTTLFDYTGKPYTLKYLAELMSISPERIFSRYDPASPVDVVVILGADWAANNPMP